jgi:WD40 repeat protein
MSSGIQTAFISAHTIFISSLQLTNDLLYSGSYDGTIKSWNTKSFERVGDIPSDFVFFCFLIRFSAWFYKRDPNAARLFICLHNS